MEENEDLLKKAIRVKDSKCNGYTLQENIPNYFTTEDFIYRYQPVNSNFRRGFVEDMTIRDVTTSERIGLLYLDPPW